MDKKLYKETLDSIRISDKAVQKALQNLRSANGTVGKVKSMTNTRRKYYKPIGIIAASLVLVLALGGIFLPRNINSFSITANAAEGETNDGGKPIIGTFSSEESSGDGEKNIYNINKLDINGENIESVTFKANRKGTYFALNLSLSEAEINSANGKTREEKYENAYKNKLGNYETKNFSYSSSKLTDDGYLCDAFTIQNEDKSEKVNLGGILKYIAEFDYSDKKVKSLSDEYDKLNRELTQKTMSGEMGFEERKQAQSKLDRLEVDMLNEMFKSASIEVTVKFTDNSQQTKKIYPEIVYDESLQNKDFFYSEINFVLPD